MADRKDKQSRKSALDRWKADQRAAARAKLPLQNEQLEALFEMLNVELRRQGCDQTLRLTQAWHSATRTQCHAAAAWEPP
jgi:hypothetical protein